MVEKKRIMKAKQYGKVKKLMGRMKEAGELPSTIQIAQEVAERDANDILRANRSAQGAGPSSEPPKKTPSARGKGQGKPEGRPEKKRGRPENASAEQALPAEGKASGPPEKKRKFNALQKLHEEAKVKKNEEAKQRQEVSDQGVGVGTRSRLFYEICWEFLFWSWCVNRMRPSGCLPLPSSPSGQEARRRAEGPAGGVPSPAHQAEAAAPQGDQEGAADHGGAHQQPTGQDPKGNLNLGGRHGCKFAVCCLKLLYKFKIGLDVGRA